MRRVYIDIIRIQISEAILNLAKYSFFCQARIYVLAIVVVVKTAFVVLGKFLTDFCCKYHLVPATFNCMPDKLFTVSITVNSCCIDKVNAKIQCGPIVPIDFLSSSSSHQEDPPISNVPRPIQEANKSDFPIFLYFILFASPLLYHRRD